MDAVVDPVCGDAEPGRELGNGQTARDAALMRLGRLVEDAMPQPDGLHRAPQD